MVEYFHANKVVTRLSVPRKGHTEVVSYLVPQTPSQRRVVTGGVRELPGAGVLSRQDVRTGYVYGSIAERRSADRRPYSVIPGAGETLAGTSSAQVVGGSGAGGSGSALQGSVSVPIQGVGSSLADAGTRDEESQKGFGWVGWVVLAGVALAFFSG